MAGIPRRADGPAAFRRIYRLRGSISPSAANSIAQAIQGQEGYAPGTLAYTNNNPGNLVYAGQAGATPGAGGFAAFDSYTDGYQAMLNQINLDATRGTDVSGNPTTTIAQLITSWAPPSQNNTTSYISFVAGQTGFDPSAPLSSLGSDSIFSSAAVTADDLSNDLSDDASSVDLSAIGIPYSVPVYALIGAGILAFALIFQRR